MTRQFAIALLVATTLLGACLPENSTDQAAPSPRASRSPTADQTPGMEKGCPDVVRGDGVTVFLVRSDLDGSRGDFAGIQRPLPRHRSRTPLRVALERLFAGTTQKLRRAGCGSMFDASGRHLGGVDLSNRTATVDLAELPSGANTTTGSHLFLLQIELTVFQFQNIRRLRLTLSGSCARFWEEMQEARRCRTLARRFPNRFDDFRVE